MNQLENTNQNIASIVNVKIFIDSNKKIVDKDIPTICIKESDLYEVSKELLEYKTGNNWIHRQTPEPIYGKFVHQRFMFTTLDGRHGMVVLEYAPIPINEFGAQRREIVNSIDVNLLD